MGVSIYYQARRGRSLSIEEQGAIENIDQRYAIGRVNGDGERVERPDWESFCIYPHDEDTEPGVIFEGATKLPLTTGDEFWEAIQHWCHVLTQIRRVLDDATWSVHIDDANVFWDDARKAYDPSIEAGTA